MVLQINYCEYCNKELQITNKSRINQKYCNYDCKKKHTIEKNKRNCIECGKEFISKYSKNHYCSSDCFNIKQKREKQKPSIICLNCNKEFKRRRGSGDTNTYCSHKCYQEHCEKKNNIKQLEPKPIQLFSLLKQSECIICNKIILSKKSKKICSNECKIKRNYYKWIFKAKQEMKQCKFCGNEFNRYTSGIRDFCSSECKDLNSKQLRKINKYPNKHRERAKKFAVEYDSKASLKWLRDKHNNICVICNKKVLKINKSGYHIDNATVGHIIAVSQGGSHTKDNIQLECMKCNCDKGIVPYFTN